MEGGGGQKVRETETYPVWVRWILILMKNKFERIILREIDKNTYIFTINQEYFFKNIRNILNF